MTKTTKQGIATLDSTLSEVAAVELNTRTFEGVSPQWDYILVRRPEHGERTKEGSSIIMPGLGRDKNEAEVLAVGPGMLHDGKVVPMPFKVGDHVVLAVANYHEIRTETADVLLAVKAGLVPFLTRASHPMSCSWAGRTPRTTRRPTRRITRRSEWERKSFAFNGYVVTSTVA